MMKHWSLAHLHVPEDVRGGGAALGAAADVHGLSLRGHRGPGRDDGGPWPHQHRHVHLSQDTLYSLSQKSCLSLVYWKQLCMLNFHFNNHRDGSDLLPDSRHESESGYISGERGLIRIGTTLKWFSAKPPHI